MSVVDSRRPLHPKSATAPDRGRRRLALGAAAGLGVAAVGGAACSSRELAPDVAYTLLDGTRGSTGALRGKVVLVNFWATTCVTCVREMPAIVRTHERYRSRGFETLAVAMAYDPPASVAHFAESRRLPFGVVIDNTGVVAGAFGNVRVTPTTFVIDKHGAIVRRHVGEPDFGELHALVEKLLAA